MVLVYLQAYKGRCSVGRVDLHLVDVIKDILLGLHIVKQGLNEGFIACLLLLDGLQELTLFDQLCVPFSDFKCGFKHFLHVESSLAINFL